VEEVARVFGGGVTRTGGFGVYGLLSRVREFNPSGVWAGSPSKRMSDFLRLDMNRGEDRLRLNELIRQVKISKLPVLKIHTETKTTIDEVEVISE
jgi:hypothetical protein